MHELAEQVFKAVEGYVRKEVALIFGRLAGISKQLQDFDTRLASIPAGPPGKDGEPGKQGEPGKDGKDGLSVVGEKGSDGRDGQPGVPGRDGKDGAAGLNGKDGADGLGFDDLTVDYDGERSFTFRMVRGDKTKEFTFSVPFPLPRGVWKEGEYERGDVVTWGGSQFTAKRKTNGKPELSDDWQLTVKRGRDGKDGVGKEGPPGKNGKDLMKPAYRGETV